MPCISRRRPLSESHSLNSSTINSIENLVIEMLIFIIPLILAFDPVAVWVLKKGGLRWLWLLCGCVLLLICLLALVLSYAYSVPSIWQLIFYLLSLFGPSIIMATGFLSFARAFKTAAQLLSALVGSLIGLVVGFLLSMYEVYVWRIGI